MDILSSEQKYMQATKIGVYLTDDVARRFKIKASRPRMTKSGIVNVALDRLLNPTRDKEPANEVLQRLGGLAKRLRRIHREVEVVAETLAVFVRYFLMITPPLPQSEQQESAGPRQPALQSVRGGDCAAYCLKARSGLRAHADGRLDPFRSPGWRRKTFTMTL
jgi:hypothetical protein